MLPMSERLAGCMTIGAGCLQPSTAVSAFDCSFAAGLLEALAQCAAMKAQGITVYTVGFDLGGDQTAINTLTQCATDPTKFYNAANDGNQLQLAFTDIALKLSSLYLSK